MLKMLSLSLSLRKVPPSQQGGAWELIRVAREKTASRVWGGKGKGGAGLVTFTF